MFLVYIILFLINLFLLIKIVKEKYSNKIEKIRFIPILFSFIAISAISGTIESGGLVDIINVSISLSSILLFIYTVYFMFSKKNVGGLSNKKSLRELFFLSIIFCLITVFSYFYFSDVPYIKNLPTNNSLENYSEDENNFNQNTTSEELTTPNYFEENLACVDYKEEINKEYISAGYPKENWDPELQDIFYSPEHKTCLYIENVYSIYNRDEILVRLMSIQQAVGTEPMDYCESSFSGKVERCYGFFERIKELQ